MAVSYLREKYKDIHFIAIEPAIKMVYDTSIDGTLIMKVDKFYSNII